MQTARKTLIGLFFILTLISCAPTEGAPDVVPTATPFPTATSFPTPTAPPDEATLPDIDVSGQNISIWYVWNRGEPDPFAEIIARFNAGNSAGVIATAENYYSYDALNAALLEQLNFSPDQLPNVVLGYPYQYLGWHAFGDRLIDLSPYLANTYAGAVDPLSEMPEVFQAQDVYGEQRLGIPAWRTAQVIVYNQTWAKELGFNASPQTFTSFTEQACAAAAINGNGTGGWIRDFAPTTLLAWLAGAGGTAITPEGTYAMNTAEMHTVFDFLYQLEAEDCAWQPDDFYPEDAFAARQALFYSTSLSAIPYLQSAMTDAGNTDEWETLSFPAQDGQPAVSVYGPSWMVLDTHAAGNQAGWLFLDYWIQPEMQEEWTETTGYLSLYIPEYAFMQPEPNSRSWGTVRWALSDAAEQLLSYGFEAVDIPRLLAQLQATAEELGAK